VKKEPRIRVVGEGLAKLLSGPCGRGRRHIDAQDALPVVGQDDEDEEDRQVNEGTAKKSMATVEPMVLEERPPGLRGVRGAA
jgi:hypothetical protein